MPVGTGTARLGREELFGAGAGRVRGVAVAMDARGAPPLHGVLGAERVFLQNLPSVLAGHALAPRPGSAVLDMCAAPGGKTTHLAALMHDRGRLVAVDRREARVAELRALVAAMRLTCVECVRGDSTRLAQFADGAFDAVLLDAPCSGLGLRPRLAEDCHARELPARAAYDRRLVAEAVRLLRPGGALVYSVCTMNPGEAEDVVAHALAAHPALELVDALPQYPGLGGPGVATASLAPDLAARVRRFTPSVEAADPSNTDLDALVRDWSAFFLSKFIKH